MSADALIICFGPLGRFVDALAAVKRVHEANAHPRLTLLTAPNLASLAAATSLFDNINTMEPPANGKGLRALAKVLKSRRYARIYDFERSALSRKLLDAIGMFGPNVAGQNRRAKWCLETEPPHPLDADADLLDLCGIGGQTPRPAPGPDLRMLLRRRAGAPSLEPEFFGLTRPFIIINLPAEGAANRWPEEQYGRLALAILAARTGCALTGPFGARALARNIARQDERIKDLCARTDFFQIAALANHAGGMVGHANGNMHLAAAAGGLVISLHQGHEDANAHSPRGRRAIAFVAPDIQTLPAHNVRDALQMFGALK